MNIPNPAQVARIHATRLAAPIDVTRLAYSTTTGTRPAAPSERDRRNAQACLDAVRQIPDLNERAQAMWRVVEQYEDDCRAAGVEIQLD